MDINQNDLSININLLQMLIVDKLIEIINIKSTEAIQIKNQKQ
jgi:hypothetical protein